MTHPANGERPLHATYPYLNALRYLNMLYMIVETFREGARPVYKRFADHGRLAPEGLEARERSMSIGS
jgi:hypothetical protein